METKDPIKKNILNAALDVLCTKGYGGTSISDIAKKAKTSKQRVHYHYRDVGQILAELAKDWGTTGRLVTLEHLAAKISPHPEEKILGICEGMFLWMKKYPKYARLTPVLFQAVSNDNQVKALFRESMTVGIERISTFLKQIPRYKNIQSAKSLEMARGIHSAMVGTALYIIGQDLWPEIDVFEKVALKAIHSILEK